MKRVLFSILVGSAFSCAHIDAGTKPKFVEGDPVVFTHKGNNCEGSILKKRESNPNKYLVRATCMIPLAKSVYMQSGEANLVVAETDLKLAE